MIKQLRLKFVAICMALVTVVLVVVFSLLYVSFRQNIDDLSRQVLHQAAQAPSRTPGGGHAPEIGITLGGDQVQLPYFTVDIWGGVAYVSGGTYTDLEDTDTLERILADCLAREADEGEISSYQLRYLRQDKGPFQRIAFVDMSMGQAILQEMMEPFVIIAVLALLLLCGAAALLSRWVTRPVERAWEQQKQFLSDASHELKTPLTIILSNAELLESAELSARPSRWVDNIRSEAGRMRALVEEMLTLARGDSMARALPLEEVSLSDVAYDCALAFEPVAFEAGMDLFYEITDETLVQGDPEGLRRILSVLLDNAIKYGAAGGTVRLSLQKTDRHARLEVSNPGEPIPPEQLPHLFERFYRADASRGEKSGFGLGLSIAAAIAKEHHGEIRAESDAVSTRFIFTIPLKKG